MKNRLARNVHWWPTGNPSRPYAVLFEGDQLELVLHEEPGKPRSWSLFVNGQRDVDFVDWPAGWTTAPDDAANQAQRAEYEHEQKLLENSERIRPLTPEDLK